MGLVTKRTRKFEKQLGRSPELVRKLVMASQLGLPERYIPHGPSPKQHAALLMPHHEVFFGGAVGGGKSDWMLMSVLMWVHIPGFHALILRRTCMDLQGQGALIPRSHEWLDGTDAVWNGQNRRWTFPSGATITFGYMKTEHDKYNYKGTEYPWIGFDELTQFSLSQYVYMHSRNRAPKHVRAPMQIRSASNPGQTGHEWVRNRFLIEGQLEKYKKERLFVPATLYDNPGLDHEAYLKKLENLSDDEIVRLRDGNWDARPSGNVFQEFWFDLIDTAIPNMCRIHRHWDLAGTEPSTEYPDPDWTAGVLMLESMGKFVILDVDRFRAGPAEVELRVRATALADQEYFGRPVSQSIEQEPGQSGKAQVDRFNRTVFKGIPTKKIRPIKNKLVRAAPAASAARNNLVSYWPLPIRVYTGLDPKDSPWGDDVPEAWVRPFLSEVGGFDGLGKKKDDQVDGFTGCFTALTDGSDDPMPIEFADNYGDDSVWSGIMKERMEENKRREQERQARPMMSPVVLW